MKRNVLEQNKVVHKVFHYMRKYHMTKPGERVVVGLSGGADSVCLLLVLKELEQRLAIQVEALHVHHGLRKEADEDEAYARALCEKLGVPFQAVHVDVKGYGAEAGVGSEEAGRILRYAQLEQSACEKIAVAHHIGDQAETVLFHLLRGTGLSGLAGIRPVRGRIIRPLLCLTREEIEGYLSEKEVVFCMDCTNNEDTYTRNKIRHHILPFAEQEICENSMEHIASAAELCAEAEDYIETQVTEYYDKCVIKEKSEEKKEGCLRVSVTSLCEAHPFLQKRIILRLFEELTPHRKDIEAVHVEAMLDLLDGQSGRRVDLPYGLQAWKEYDMIVIKSRQDWTPRNSVQTGIAIDQALLEREKVLEVVMPDGEIVCLTLLEGAVYSENIPQKKYTKWFDYDRIKGYLVLRYRQTGDFLQIYAGKEKPFAKKMLKDYFITEKIPRQEREKILLVAEASHVLWVTGYRISEYYKVGKETKHILQVQIKGEKADV